MIKQIKKLIESILYVKHTTLYNLIPLINRKSERILSDNDSKLDRFRVTYSHSDDLTITSDSLSIYFYPKKESDRVISITIRTSHCDVLIDVSFDYYIDEYLVSYEIHRYHSGLDNAEFMNWLNN